ncbi:MAG: DUF3821 domain-containing protein [Methanolinea sp.]|jgi:hypothetical protein|nr:DUF3821 domain-containing protein [Methanolinea sp.]
MNKIHIARLSGIPVLILLSLVLPSMAACGTIAAGEWVFIGEEGLDITGTGVTAGSQIAYYGPGGSVSSVPAAQVTVADPSSFYVAPSVFLGKTGPWFTLPENNLAFYVGDPTIQVRIVDYTSGFVVGRDATWVPKGDIAGFRIDTNLWVFSHRKGCTGVPLTIEITGPGGLSFSSLGGYRLGDVVVSTPTFESGPVWATGSGEYPIGDYIVSVRCEANNMHDNYPVTGKSQSEQVRFLLQKVNPLIATMTTTAVTETATAVTSTPGTTDRLESGTTVETSVMMTVPSTAETVPPMLSARPTRAPGLLPATLFLALCAGLVLHQRRERQGHRSLR